MKTPQKLLFAGMVATLAVIAFYFFSGAQLRQYEETAVNVAVNETMPESAETDTMSEEEYDEVEDAIHGNGDATPASEPVAITEDGTLLDPLKRLPGDRVQGNPDSKIWVIEYASLSCHHCAYFHGEIYPQLKEKYIDTGKIAFVFRHFPLNEPAIRGAMLAECSGDKFHTFIKVLFQMQDKWAYSMDFMDSLEKIANTGGMSSERFQQCMQDTSLQEHIVAGLQLASEKLNVRSTPTIFVNGEMVNATHSFEALSEQIDAHLE